MSTNSHIKVAALVIIEIRKRSRQFVDDNFVDPTPAAYIVVENAMLIGATIQTEITQQVEAEE